MFTRYTFCSKAPKVLNDLFTGDSYDKDDLLKKFQDIESKLTRSGICKATCTEIFTHSFIYRTNGEVQ